MKKQANPRRAVALILIASMLFGLCACGGPESVTAPSDTPKEIAEAQEPSAVQASPSAVNIEPSEEPVEAPREPTQDELWPEQETDVYYYYYDQLSYAERSAYRCILGNLLELNTKFEVLIEAPGATGERIIELLRIVTAEHPELFWVGQRVTWTDYSDAERADIVMTVDFTSEDLSEIETKQGYVDWATENALSYIYAENPETQYEYVRTVFEYIIDTVDYQLESPDNQNLYSALVNGVSVCAGYAAETCYLLQKLGFPALVVTGETETAGHAWNMVYLYDNWYQIDTTAGDPTFEDPDTAPTLTDGMQYHYGYLCISDTLMYRDRYVDESFSTPAVPVCSADDLNAYYLSGNFYWDFDWQVNEAMTQALADWAPYFRIQFAYAEDFDAFCSAIQSDEWWQDRMAEAGIYSFSTNYSTNDDLYIVDMTLSY